MGFNSYLPKQRYLLIYGAIRMSYIHLYLFMYLFRKGCKGGGGSRTSSGGLYIIQPSTSQAIYPINLTSQLSICFRKGCGGGGGGGSRTSSGGSTPSRNSGGGGKFIFFHFVHRQLFSSIFKVLQLTKTYYYHVWSMTLIRIKYHKTTFNARNQFFQQRQRYLEEEQD